MLLVCAVARYLAVVLDHLVEGVRGMSLVVICKGVHPKAFGAIIIACHVEVALWRLSSKDSNYFATAREVQHTPVESGLK